MRKYVETGHALSLHVQPLQNLQHSFFVQKKRKIIWNFKEKVRTFVVRFNIIYFR